MKLATIEKIHTIIDHPNADTLSCAFVKAWPVVVKKGQFKENELIVFIQIDSIVPKENSYFSFMEKQHYRVWSAKFRKAPSQGLVCPLSILPKFQPIGEMIGVMTYGYNNGKVPDGELKFCQEGDDVTETLGIIKYEKPLDLSVCGDAKGGFPTHLIPMTDEDNLLNNPKTLEEFNGELCYLTVKADGSSMTVIYDGNVRVCSRKLEQKEGTGFWKIAELYDLSNKLKTFNKNIAIQSEAVGGKIQGNPMGLSEPSMFVFNIKEIDTGKWYSWDEIKELCFILKLTPVLPIMENFTFNMTIGELQDIANHVIYTTFNGEKRNGEGVVLRPNVPKYSPSLGKMLSVKILNQNYKQ